MLRRGLGSNTLVRTRHAKRRQEVERAREVLARFAFGGVVKELVAGHLIVWIRSATPAASVPLRMP